MTSPHCQPVRASDGPVRTSEWLETEEVVLEIGTGLLNPAFRIQMPLNIPVKDPAFLEYRGEPR